MPRKTKTGTAEKRSTRHKPGRRLNQQLNTLEGSGLIGVAQMTPELEYLFRHALIQDAAYESLLKADRKHLHRRVAETLEQLYPAQREELAAVLAQHFAGADDDARALVYFTLAGDVAARIYANAEAVMHYSRALECAARLPTITTEQLLHLYTSRGRALQLSNQHAHALENYRELASVARGRGDRQLELASLMARATLRATPNPLYDLERGQALLEEARTLAHALNDRQAESKALWNLMLLNYFAGQLRASINFGEQSLALARELGLREQLAFTLNDLTRSYGALGQFAAAEAVSVEARALWEELGNLPMLADNLNSQSENLYFAGEYDRSLALAEEGFRVSLSAHNQWGQSYSLWMQSYVYLDRGEVSEGLARLERSLELGQQAGFLPVRVAGYVELALVNAVLGNIERGLETCRQASTYLDSSTAWVRPWVLSIQARIQVLARNLSEARALIQESRAAINPENFNSPMPQLMGLAEGELAFSEQAYARVVVVTDDLLNRLRQFGIYPGRAEAGWLKGRALMALNRADDAHQTLIEARREAEHQNLRRVLWRILLTLSDIADQRAQPAEAQRLRREAQACAAFIADHCPPELRESFLNLPDVKRVTSDV
jgi:hypothetical protein